MKKIICIVLSICLLLPVFASAAETDAELTKVVTMAKKALSVPAEYTEFENHRQERNGENVYTLIWSVKDSSKRIYCEVHDENIVTYEKFDPETSNRTGKAEFSKEKYAAFAAEWVKKVNPSFSKELATDGSVELGNANSGLVWVSFDRSIGGVEVQGNGVYFTLDKFSGEVISMNASWTKTETIEKNENIISAEEAGNALLSLSELSLRYRKLPEEKRAILIYEPIRRGMMVSAKNGEEFTAEYDDNLKLEKPMAPGGGAMEDATVNGVLTENEIKAIDELSSLITKAEVEAKIKKMAGTTVAGYTLQSVNYMKANLEEDEYTYHVRAVLRGENNAFGEVVFNAEDGELLSFYSYAPGENTKLYDKKYDELKKTAERFVKTYAPDEAEKARLTDESEDTTYFAFVRHENDIMYRENYISVSMNRKTGKITSFSKAWDEDVEFDSADGIIGAEQAGESFISACETKLFYVPNGMDVYAYGSARELRLVYILSGKVPEYIDAKTGEALTWELQPPVEEKEYELQDDVKNHFSASAVRTLADNGTIISKEEKFLPDSAVTYYELARAIFSFQYGNYIEPDEKTYEKLMKEAVSLGYIDRDKKGSESVLREDAAKSIVSLLGVGKAASLTGIYKTGFSDEGKISAARLGAVALAKGFGIIKGDGGAFHPKRVLTRGELCVMLANSYGK